MLGSGGQGLNVEGITVYRLMGCHIQPAQGEGEGGRCTPIVKLHKYELLDGVCFFLTLNLVYMGHSIYMICDHDLFK